jgi:hypothetical protein
MELWIEPEPGPEEREAIELALERLLDGDSLAAAYASAWRNTGIHENIDTGKTAYATARPRRSPGATRA